MVLLIPGLIYLFGLSLRDHAGFRTMLSILHSMPVKLLVTLLVWTIVHHVLAGIRFLLMDMNLGEQLAVAKLSAWIVNTAGVLVFVLFVFKIWS